MGEIELVNSIRDVVVDTVRGAMKPVSVQIATYLGNRKVQLDQNLNIDAVVPSSVGEINPGDSVLMLKEDGQNKYYVIAKI